MPSDHQVTVTLGVTQLWLILGQPMGTTVTRASLFQPSYQDPKVAIAPCDWRWVTLGPFLEADPLR